MSDLPLWVQYTQALGIPAGAFGIALVGAWVADQQRRIARAKLRHDLFDRRFRVFEAVRAFLVEVFHNGDASDDALRSYTLGTADAGFLFDDRIVAYIEEVRQRAIYLHESNRVIEGSRDGSEERVSAAERKTEHMQWMMAQARDLHSRFSEFLKLPADW